jgi:hypothetical protein
MPVSILHCPVCTKRIDYKSSVPSILICPGCICSYQKSADTAQFLQQEKAVLEDMTPLRLGTTGQFEGQTFEVIGRIQYNFEKNYRNLWAVLFTERTYGWIAEAYGDYMMLQRKDFLLNASVIAKLKAGRTLELPDQKSYEVERVDINETIYKEGELPEHNKENTRFTSVELSTANREKALIHLLAHYKTTVYTGLVLTFESFNFKHLRDLRDWI